MLVITELSIHLIADKALSLPKSACLFFSAKYHLCIEANALSAVKLYLHIKIFPLWSHSLFFGKSFGVSFVKIIPMSDLESFISS